MRFQSADPGSKPSERAPRLAMLVPEFPGQTHSWIWREARVLRSCSIDLRFVSTRAPKSPCPHEFAAAARAQTHYLHPPGLATGRALARGGGVRALRRYAGAMHASGWAERLRVIALAMAALELREWAAANAVDHVHVHSCASAAHIAAMSRAAGGPPYSLTLHGDLEVYGGDHALKMRDAAFISTAGEHLVPQVLALGIPADRVFSNPMGVDVDRFAPVERRPSAALRVVTVARLHRGKGHLHVLEAVRRLRDEGICVSYRIVGEGPDRNLIAQAVRDLGLVDQVELTGAASESEVARILRESDVYVLASVAQGEAAPVGVMEAMSTGCPVVCSRIGSTADMVEAGVSGFLTPQGDVEAIAAALRTLLDPALRTEIGRKARAAAVARFDARHSALRLLARIFPTLPVDRPAAAAAAAGDRR